MISIVFVLILLIIKQSCIMLGDSGHVSRGPAAAADVWQYQSPHRQRGLWPASERKEKWFELCRMRFSKRIDSTFDMHVDL